MNQYTVSGLPFDLSVRELQVLELMFQDMTMTQIGLAMHLSPKTIATYKYRALGKMKVKSVIGAYLKLHPPGTCEICKTALKEMDPESTT
jgi:DNA-binding CsgD family transcriptional regulator